MVVILTNHFKTYGNFGKLIVPNAIIKSYLFYLVADFITTTRIAVTSCGVYLFILVPLFLNAQNSNKLELNYRKHVVERKLNFESFNPYSCYISLQYFVIYLLISIIISFVFSGYITLMNPSFFGLDFFFSCFGTHFFFFNDIIYWF